MYLFRIIRLVLKVSVLRNKFIQFMNGGIKVIEEEFTVVEPSSLLVKPLFIYIGVVEKKLFHHLNLINKPVIPGSSGVVKIIEDPSGTRGELSGKTAIVSPFGRRGLLGYDINGLLTHFSSIPYEYLLTFVNDASPIQALIPYLAYSTSIAKLMEPPVAVIGCDIIAASTALYVKLVLNDEPVLLCSDPPKGIWKLGLKPVDNVNYVNKFYSSILVDNEEFWFTYDALRELKYRSLFVSPFSNLRFIPLRKGFEAKISFIDEISGFDEKSIKTVVKFIRRAVGFIKVKDVSDLTYLIPPKGLGVIVGYEESNVRNI